MGSINQSDSDLSAPHYRTASSKFSPIARAEAIVWNLLPVLIPSRGD
jgi:hypothetical protein